MPGVIGFEEHASSGCLGRVTGRDLASQCRFDLDVLSHPVGTTQGHKTVSDVRTNFLHFDNFPYVASWVAAKRAEETLEGQEIMSAFKQANTPLRTLFIVGESTEG